MDNIVNSSSLEIFLKENFFVGELVNDEQVSDLLAVIKNVYFKEIELIKDLLLKKEVKECHRMTLSVKQNIGRLEKVVKKIDALKEDMHNSPIELFVVKERLVGILSKNSDLLNLEISKKAMTSFL